MNVVTRSQAIENGSKRYFTGVVCSNGHVSERYVVSRMCVDCAHSHNTADSKKEYAVEYRANNKEKAKQYRVSKKDDHKQWLKNNSSRTRQYRKTYREKYPDKVNYTNSKRRASKLKATTSWDEELTNLVIQEAYHLTKLREKATGFTWHVDHVIPLQGKSVCGLHVWNNLAVIPASENLSKNNSYVME